MKRISDYWNGSKLPVAVALLLVVAGFVGAQWQQRIDSTERDQIRGLFPKVRTDAAASATEAANAKNAVEMKGLRSENETLKSALSLLATAVGDTHNLVIDIKRYLGERAVLADKRNAQLQQKTAKAADAAVDAKETAEKVDQKVSVAAVKADEAAITAKAVDKKLDAVTHPTLPARPWAGSTGGH